MKKIFLALCVLSLFHLKAEKFYHTYEVVEDKSELEILSPALADRKTAKIRLPNGMEAYLISDPVIEQSAAALAVEAGSWNDPDEYPGSAHFLEHLLFMGTKAYPQEDGFMPFIKENGGKINAYTASDRTVYMFSANNAAFEEALDRFSHFFIDPLLNTSSIDRELHAVDQEHAKNIENDGWRQYMIIKETGNPEHPNAKFSTGNAKTLSGIPREVIKKWYEEKYSAEKMHLVVLSALPIDELIELITQDFSNVPNHSVVYDFPSQPMMSDEQLGHMIYIKPVKDLKVVSLTWELPQNLAENEEAKVGELLAYVFKSGSKNSLLGLLKKEHLAEAINASPEQFGKKAKLFTLEVELTDKGIQKIDSVIKHCFEALARLKSTGIPQYIFEEVERISQIKYQYQSRIDSFDFVMKTAHTLVDEKLETFPRKTLLPTKYDAKQIRSYINYLTPEHCLICVIADPSKTGIAPTKKEKWMQAEYAVKPVPSKLMRDLVNASTHPQIGLPSPNPYIPTNFTLVHKTISNELVVPTLLLDNDQGKVFVAEDQKYLIPEVAHVFRLKSPLLDGSAKAQVLTDLYIKAMQDELFPIISAAESAGAKIFIKDDHFSIAVGINAFSDHSDKLTTEVLSHLKDIRPKKAQFDIYKSSLASDYENSEKELLFIQVQQSLNNLLFNDSHTPAEKLSSLAKISYEEFLQFVSNVFKKAYIQGLLYGNLTKDEASTLLTNIKHKMKAEEYSVKEHLERSILLLSEGQGPCMVAQPTSMQGNATILMIEQGPYTFQSRACQQVLSTVLQNLFFDTLRTKQQVAYIAKAWDKSEENQLLQLFAVQSSTHLPGELIARFELFLENFVKQFTTELPRERFENVRKMSIATLQIPEENLITSAGRLFLLGFDYDGDFHLIEKRVHALEQLTYEETRAAACDIFSRKNTRRLAVLMEGAVPREKNFRYELVSKEDLLRGGTYVTKRETLLTENPAESLEILR